MTKRLLVCLFLLQDYKLKVRGLLRMEGVHLVGSAFPYSAI